MWTSLFNLILTCSDMLSKVQMQAKCEVFSRFGSSVDFSSGEPLSGVEAPTVGADLCVRPSSPELSLFCGRTRRSAPTQATSARQFHSSNAVTSICFLSSHASKKRSFFSFRKFGRLLFGEPLVGVGAPTPCRGGAPGAKSFLS